MKVQYLAPLRLSRTLLAATTALVLSGPAYAADPETTDKHAAADRTVSEATPADNSVHNAGDAEGNGLTPLDQSSAKADVEMTRSIRQRLVDDASLGTNAQNVKVITVDGVVTLRGAVASADQRARVDAIAKGTAGADRVRNELEVIKR